MEHKFNKHEIRELKYAQTYYRGENKKQNLTETVHCYTDYLPDFFTLPHPSPGNNIWQKKNPSFASDLLPKLKIAVKKALVENQGKHLVKDEGSLRSVPEKAMIRFIQRRIRF